MDFEYGCSTTNKFCFLDENEVEDPSDLLAQATKEPAKDAKTGKDAKGKPKSADPKAKTAGKDGKKQPLQQQTDNSVKKTGDALKTDAKKTGQAKQTAQTPREDKENTSNRQSGQGQRNGEQRRPRPEGQTGELNRGQDRPPRRTGPPRDGPPRDGPRPDGPRPERPPRRPRDENQEGAMVGDENAANLEGGEGFRRTGNSAGYRGPRTGAGGERRSGGFRGGPGGFGRPRRSNDPDHPREFDRHSGSEKTGIKAVDKKEGAGKGNWGTATDELAAEGEVLNETQEQATENQNWAERVEESEEKGEEEDKEQLPNFMTLDEYKALKNQVNKKNDFNIRRPGEGEDLSKWGKTYVLPKKPADEDEEEEEEEEENEEETEENEEDEKKKQLLSQIQFKFYDSNADRRGNDRRQGGDRRGGERRQGGEPRQRRPQPEGEAQPQPAQTQPAQGETATPQAPTDETSSPSGKPRFNRGPASGQQRGNNNQRRGPRDAQGGQSRGNQKAPKFDDEKDFPSLGK